MSSMVPISHQVLVFLGAKNLKTSHEENTHHCPWSNWFTLWFSTEQKALALESGGSHTGVLGINVHTSASAWWRLCPHSHGSEFSLFPMVSISLLNAAQNVAILAAWASKNTPGGKCHGRSPHVPYNWSRCLCDKALSQFQLHFGCRPDLSYFPGTLLLKWHSFPVRFQPAYPWELLPAHAAAAGLPAWTSPLTPQG